MRKIKSMTFNLATRYSLLATIILCALCINIMAQEKNMIDGVVWVVGDEAILRSDVEQERIRAQYEGQRVQGDPYCIIPEQVAIQKLFIHQAKIDSITVNGVSYNGETLTVENGKIYKISISAIEIND